eukprot:5895930-Amphidinium_carterae.1
MWIRQCVPELVRYTCSRGQPTARARALPELSSATVLLRHPLAASLFCRVSSLSSSWVSIMTRAQRKGSSN